LLFETFNLHGMAKPAKTFKDLVVWQKAHRFVLATYSLTANFPRSEIYCLTNQMRRAAISVPANIAEGFRKRGPSDKTRLLNVAQGSLEECRYYLILTQDLGYSTTAEMEHLLEEVSKLLVAYASAIESNRRTTPKFCNS
jgi:four helix bundle protein